jgi:hypothetical protein
MSQRKPWHVISPTQESSPLHCTSHVLSSGHSIPPPHAPLPHVTEQARSSGHSRKPAHAPPSEQSKTHPWSTHSAPTAAHSAMQCCPASKVGSWSGSAASAPDAKAASTMLAGVLEASTLPSEVAHRPPSHGTASTLASRADQGGLTLASKAGVSGPLGPLSRRFPIPSVGMGSSASEPPSWDGVAATSSGSEVLASEYVGSSGRLGRGSTGTTMRAASAWSCGGVRRFLLVPLAEVFPASASAIGDEAPVSPASTQPSVKTPAIVQEKSSRVKAGSASSAWGRLR